MLQRINKMPSCYKAPGKNFMPGYQPVFTKKLRYLVLFLLQLFYLLAFSQKQKLKFDHPATLDGLSQSNVLCIFQDSRGFMWFGTQAGLNKYDGYKFTVYKNDPYNKNSLSHNFIGDIIEDREGNLWMAIRGGGINKFNRRQEHFTAYKHRNAINSLSSGEGTTLFHHS